MARQIRKQVKGRPRPRRTTELCLTRGTYRCPTCATEVTVHVKPIGLACNHTKADSRPPCLMVRVARG